MSIDSLFQHLHESYKAAQATQELVGRMLGLRWAIVSEVATDPAQTALAMVKVKMPHQGANSDSDWLMRVVPWQGLSVPMPVVGDTILVGFDDGNPNTTGFYLGIPNNLLNPAYKKPDVWRYDFSDDIWLEVSKDTIKFTAFACSITIAKEFIDLTAPMITFNGNPATAMSMVGGNLNFSVPGKVKAKGKNIAVIGALDSRGDSITDDTQ